MDCQAATALQLMELFKTIHGERSELVAENDDEKNADLVAEMTAAMRVIMKKIVRLVQGGTNSATAPQSDPSLSVEITGLSVATTEKNTEISPPPAPVRGNKSCLVEKAGPSVATVQENNKPALVDDSDPFGEISLPTTPFLVKYSRLAEILLDDSRSLAHCKLSPSINRALALKAITSLTSLQQEMAELLVDMPKGWYIERCKGPHNKQKGRQFVGANEYLKEGETAFEGVLEGKELQQVVCLTETYSRKTLAYLLPIYKHLLVGDKSISNVFGEEVEAIMGTRLRVDCLSHESSSSQYKEEHTTKAESLISSDYEYIDFDLPEENAEMQYSLVKQTFVEAGEDQSERFDALTDILFSNKPARTLVLCQTHASVEWLHEAIASMEIALRSFHGAYSQEELEDTIRAFEEGLVIFVVSTMGIAWRGLDVKDVDYLIFWEMPGSLEQYKRCLGRMGRLGNPAKAFVLFPKGERPTEGKYAKFLEVNKVEFQMIMDGQEVLVNADAIAQEAPGEGIVENDGGKWI